MEYLIETKDLIKQYGTKKAVDNVSIHVAAGEIYGLIGRNGAGKTTLLKLLLGLISPTGGEMNILANDPQAHKKIGSLIEEPGLYKNCTAHENMLRFAILYGADESTIDPILTKVGLGNTGNKKAGEFSLGMRQRLGLAIALLNEPQVLILDEPINGLDPAGIKEFRSIIQKLNKEGVTFVISSHILDELAKIVTTYGILSDGKLIEEFSAADLKLRCTDFGKIVSSDNAKAIELIKANYPDVEAKQNGKIIEISKPEKLAEINALLVKNNILVSELSKNAASVEDYFLERLGK